MLNAEEFKKWCNKLDLSEQAIELVNRIRTSEPSRAVGGGHRNVVGSYPSIKMRKSIQFESHTVELAGIYLKEHDDSVVEMYDQPERIRLSYTSTEKVVTIYTTPDYFVLYDDKAGWEEWKTEEELLKKSKTSDKYVFQDGEWHCPSGEEYARQFGLYFWVKSSKDINKILVRNLIFLEDYLLDSQREIEPESEKGIMKFIENESEIPLNKLIVDCNNHSDDIYYLIARNKIYVDVECELLSETEYTCVYPDKATADAYKAAKITKRPPIFENQSLDIAPGVHITWDSVPWTIVNVGENNIALSSSKGFTEIPKKQFLDLACEKHITADENEILKENDSYVLKKLTEADKTDLDEANRRYKLLLPILEGGKIEDTKKMSSNIKKHPKLDVSL